MTSPVMISAFFEDIASLHIDKIIIGGDFNVGLEYEDTTNDAIHCPRVAEHIKWYMHEWNLSDIWWVFNPTKKCFTRYTYTHSQAQKGQATGNRIDFFLTSQEFTLHTKDVDILPSFKTDYAMPSLTLSKTDKASYLPIWHFPSFVSDKKLYYDVLDRTVKETIKDNPNASASTLWEVMKCNIQLATDLFRKSMRSREREKLQVLNRQLNKCEEKRDTITPEVCTLNSAYNEVAFNKKLPIMKENFSTKYTPFTYKYIALNEKSHITKQNLCIFFFITGRVECMQLLLQIEKLQNYYSVTQVDMTDKIIDKRIALFYEKSETVSKYFLSFGRKHPRNHVHSLFNKNSALLTENREILREAKNFYQTLFMSKQLELDELPLLQDFLLQDYKTLVPSQYQVLDCKLTYKEASVALQGMSNKKAPGLDGFTTEFYKHAWHIVCRFVYEFLMEAYQNGQLSTVQRRGVICLLPKKGKNPNWIDNFCPITLLNVDRKILS